MEDLTAKQIERLNGLNIHTKSMRFGQVIQAIIDVLNSGAGESGAPGLPGEQGAPGDKGPTGDPGPCSVIPEGTPVNAISAFETLTISNVVIDGETVTVNNPEEDGVDVYEFSASTALTVGEGHIPVDINNYTTKATDNLVVDTNPTPGNTMTIGTKTFTFVPNGTANADGEIDIEASLAETQANIIVAIKGTDGHNEPHELVTCGAAFGELDDTLAITALVGGSAGNAIDTTETFTEETNAFSADKLATGADCSAADAVTALVAAIIDSDTQGVGAVDGDGNTVVLTADVGGVITNAIEIAEDMANGTFGEDVGFLSGGEDGTVGIKGVALMDASFLYICKADNDVTGKNWHRISLGEAD